ncbi:hypothetical protein V8E55_002654 [Tylopilus felleus]
MPAVIDAQATTNNLFDRPATKPALGVFRNYHDKLTGEIYNADGQPIDSNAPCPPASDKQPDNWSPYGSKLQFESADFIFQQAEMSAGNIDWLFELWGDPTAGGKPPFSDHKEIYQTIDATLLGDVPWDSIKLKYSGDHPDGAVPPWMDQTYEFWYRPAYALVVRMLSNTDFNSEFDYVPYRDFLADSNQRRYENLMSDDWAWRQADKIAEDPSTIGSTFMPIILGSDKTTVSVATGQNDYWPVYLSIGNIHNNVRCAYCNGVELLALLAIPKAAKKYTDDPAFCKFKKQLFHAAMAKILCSLKPGMTMPQLMKCPDWHLRHVIFGLGPYIADYLEQVLVSGIVQNCSTGALLDIDGGGGPWTAELTHGLMNQFSLGVLWDEWGIDGTIPFTDDFLRTDICQLLAPDILHQLIKGVFKDHLVEWVSKYLEITYGKSGAKEWLADIDRCIATAPPFPGLRRFPDVTRSVEQASAYSE